ncbi:MAG: protein kinase [Deltaproteobacteria bacterium]|nr:protein kinase [Deltaproteobacteria bacterium]
MTAQALTPGNIIGGRFQVEAHLGGGGLGDLYKALDQKTEKPVAIRILASELARSDEVMERLRGQIKRASGLNHKNIARVFGMGKEGSLRYLASEYIEGHSLRQLVERKRRTGKTFSLKGAYNVIAHLCNALEEGHHQLIHGLPGPGAVIVNRAGRVKLADFGIVAAMQPNSAFFDQLGDRYAMAPELPLAPESITAAADVFTVGVVLHELLTGVPPSTPREPMSNLVNGINPAVESVVNRCLQGEPSGRFTTLAEVKAAFYAAIQDDSVQDPVAQKPQPPTQAHVQAQPQPQPQAPLAVVSPQAPPQGAPSGPVVTPMGPLGGIQPQPTGPFGLAPSATTSGTFNPLDAQLGAGPQAVNIQSLLAETGDATERWLIQKDRLDFGPFSLGDIKQQMYKGEFSGDEIIVDQETGDRGSIRHHPDLAEFTRVLERHQQVEAAHQNVAQADRQDRRRRALVVSIVMVSLVVLAGAGIGLWYFVFRKPPETREKIVYRDRPGNLSIKVAFNSEPADQAKKRRAWRKRPRRRKKQASGSDVTYLGDASKSGGDALLSQGKIQRTMARGVNKLTRCVQNEYRRNRTLRKVTIAFGVKGSGDVSYSKVNGQTSGPFHRCISRKMRLIKFPKYDGGLTHASFTMTLGF